MIQKQQTKKKQKQKQKKQKKKNKENFSNEKIIKITRREHAFKGFASTYLQLKVY